MCVSNFSKLVCVRASVCEFVCVRSCLCVCVHACVHVCVTTQTVITLLCALQHTVIRQFTLYLLFVLSSYMYVKHLASKVMLLWSVLAKHSYHSHI